MPELPEWVEPVARYMFEVGLKGTLRIAAFSMAGSAVIGIVLGTLLTIKFLPMRAAIRLYIEVWRGLPIIVTIGLTLWGSAQVAEATRGAVESIPREQHEAAAALGFGWSGRHAFVILPQAFRRLLPPLVSLLVNILQNSTIAQVIGAAELLETGERSVERLTIQTFEIHPFEIYGAVMVVFFLMSFPLTRLAAYLERRLVQ